MLDQQLVIKLANVYIGWVGAQACTQETIPTIKVINVAGVYAYAQTVQIVYIQYVQVFFVCKLYLHKSVTKF